MSAALQIVIALASVAVLIGLMAVVRRFAEARGWAPEVQRKMVHIGTGLYAITLPWLFADRWPVLMLIGITIVLMLVLRLPQFAKGGIGETLHGVERKSYGDLLLALAVGVVFLLADQPVLYVLPLAILTLSDAAAALTGSAYGRRFFTVEDGRKSIEGSVAFFMTSFCLSMICLLIFADTPRVNVIYLAAIVAAFGTLIEADSWRGFDNFFLPAGLMVFLQGHLQTPPPELFLIMAVFLAAIWAALVLGPRIGVPAHSARVYVTAAFLVLVVVDPADAVLPLLVFAAHHVAQHRSPDDASRPELDCVAAVALMSFFWLVLGRASGTFNLELFGLTALSMCISYITLAAAAPRRLLVGCLAATLGAVLYSSLMATDGPHNTILVALPSLVIGAALATLLPSLQPAWFDTGRALRVAGLAMIVPMAVFATQYPAIGG